MPKIGEIWELDIGCTVLITDVHIVYASSIRLYDVIVLISLAAPDKASWDIETGQKIRVVDQHLMRRIDDDSIFHK